MPSVSGSSTSKNQKTITKPVAQNSTLLAWQNTYWSPRCDSDVSLLLMSWRLFRQNAPWIWVHRDKKQVQYDYAHSGFFTMFRSHCCSSTKKQRTLNLRQETELFLKFNLSVDRMKLICWKRNKYQSKFPLACWFISNWARGNHLFGTWGFGY